MTTNTDETGRSVYISCNRLEHDKKSEQPLYSSVREIVHRIAPHPKQAVIVDLGCSDLVASGPLLKEGYRVIGLDLDPSSLAQAKEYYPDAELILGDVRCLPMNLEGPDTKIVLLLDILEHLDAEDAIRALQNMKTQMGGRHTLIVSMPNISPFSFYTLKEAVKMSLAGERPQTGLFDRTHKILTDIRGHRELFMCAGYEVTEMYITAGNLGVSGEWQWKHALPDNNHSGSDRSYLKEKAYRFLFGKVSPILASRIRNVDAEIAEFIATGYQGLYVLCPNND